MNWQRNKSYMILQSIHTERIGGPFQAVFAPESYYNLITQADFLPYLIETSDYYGWEGLPWPVCGGIAILYVVGLLKTF